MAKRILLFVLTNILVVATASLVLSLLGVGRYTGQGGLAYGNLAVFCLVWGFVGSFVSLLLSKVMARWMMGVQTITAEERDPDLSWVRQTTLRLARQAGLPKDPEVGFYEAEDMNAFATGPTRGSALVAVSTGLLHRMSRDEVEGVLAHEIAHVANGDMVTMTLLQGVVNAFVMFFSRVVVHGLSQAVDEKVRPVVQLVGVFVFEILLGFLGLLVVARFSRAREFRADAGGAKLGGREKMVGALRALQRQSLAAEAGPADGLAAFKIAGGGTLGRLFSTHPPLEERIAALQSYR